MTSIKIIEANSIPNLELAVNNYLRDWSATIEVINVTIGTYVSNENILHVATILFKKVD